MGAMQSKRRSAGRALAVTMLLAVGCSSIVGGARDTTSADERRELRPSQARATRPDRDALLREALAGVVEPSGDGLDGRLALRNLRMPKPPRGATARFELDDGKRAFVTSLPHEDVLTSVAYARGKVFLGGGFASHQFYAFDAFSGELSWSLDAPDGGPTPAVIFGERVIFNTESCTLFVADADTGALRWKRWLGDPLMSQPAVSENLVLSAYPAEGAHRFGAFRLEDGEPVWTVPIGADVIQAPHVQGDSAFFTTMEGEALRVRVRDGHVMWRKPIGATSATWVDRDRVLVTRRVDEGGHAFEEPVVLDVASGRVVRTAERVPAPYLEGRSRDRQLAAAQSGAWGSVPHGARLGLANVASGWAFQGSSPTVADGRAYLAVGSELVAREVATGEIVWRKRYAQAEGAQAVTPPAVVGSLLVFGTVDGHLYFTDIDTGLTVRAYDVGEPIVFQPVVAQGWVYVTTGKGRLVGLEVSDPSFDGWHMWGGNEAHAGPVAGAGRPDPALLASLDRPGRGTMRIERFEETATDANEAAPEAEAAEEDEAPTADLAATQVDPRGENLPTLSTRFEASVSGYVGRVVVSQRFENPHDRPIEALYLFPLPPDAAVDDMEMRIGNRVVRGVIRRRQEARDTYEQARSEGRRAALLEQRGASLFAERVANIGPGEAIEVRLRYVQMLPFEDGRYELVLPMVAERRFDPASPTAAAEEQEALRRAGRAEVSVRVRAGMPLESIESPTHRASIRREGTDGAVVEVDVPRPDRDFVLRYGVSGAIPRATVLAHRDERQGYFGLVVQPPAAPASDEVTPRDVTFVVDTSSSMKGLPLEQARTVIRRVVQGLGAGDRVNVLAFADRVLALGAAPVAAGDATSERVERFLGELRTVGATRMIPAIEQALAQPSNDASRLRLVVLLTDGFVGNETEVLRSVVGRLGDARLYTIGLGASPNRFLLERAAEVGRGRSLVAAPAENAGEVAERFAALVEKPVFTDVEIDWGDLAVRDVYPAHLPDLFAGKPLVVHGRFDRGGRATIKLRGSIRGRRFEREVEVELPARPTNGDTGAHATLWARAAIHSRLASLWMRESPGLVEAVTELGLAHRIVTPYTSFVAVEERVEPAGPDEARLTVTPSRALPGDPEIRIPAPRDARAVTVVLPFGETVAAEYETTLGVWTARFLIPRDTPEGNYPIDVFITHADGHDEHIRVWYTVDATAPEMDLEIVSGELRPGEEIVVRATQRDALLPGGADARRVELRLPNGGVVDMGLAGRGTWEARFTVPAVADGRVPLGVFAIDLAANVGEQRVVLGGSR